jgi:hypothetical protein
VIGKKDLGTGGVRYIDKHFRHGGRKRVKVNDLRPQASDQRAKRASRCLVRRAVSMFESRAERGGKAEDRNITLPVARLDLCRRGDRAMNVMGSQRAD